MQSQAIWMPRHSCKLHGGFPWPNATAEHLRCNVMHRFVAALRVRERQEVLRLRHKFGENPADLKK
jgi:hypothetical protein